MFSFAYQAAFKYRISFSNERLNKTSKLSAKALFLVNIRR